MWKITVVMFVTAVFAGLLIHSPNGLSSESAASAISARHAPSTAVAAVPAPASRVPSRPPSIQIVASREPVSHVVPQARDPSESVDTLIDRHTAESVMPQKLKPASMQQDQACKRDAEMLARLRASQARDEVIRFELALGCERLRPQVVRLRESVSFN
jgi:hypothetical protein